jgi:hypothetical protein
MATEVNALNCGSFWQRQIAPRATPGQVGFDVVFGIVMPIVCLYFDPIVFRSESLGPPLFGSNMILCACAIGLGLFSLAGWLIVLRPSALLAGILAGGAILALLLGLMLFPLSMLFPFVPTAFLGFTPLATALTFGRNAIRVYRRVGPTHFAPALAGLGLAISCAGPVGVQSYIHTAASRAAEFVASHDADQAGDALTVLKRFRLCGSADRLLLAFEAENNAIRRERLGAAYLGLTGEDVGIRIAKRTD